MTSIALPIMASPAGQAPALPVLQPGAVMQALVLGLIDDMTMRLQLPGGILDVKAQSILPAGARLLVAVEGSAAQPKLVLTPLPAGTQSVANPQGSAGALPAGVGAPPSGPSRTITRPLASIATAPSAASPAPQSAAMPIAHPSPQAANADPVETAIAALVRHAIGRQNGIAPLLADLETMLARPGLDVPQPVRAAAEQVLAQRLDLRAPVDADAIKSAMVAAGLATPGVAPSQVPADIKAALNILRVALANWSLSEPEFVPKGALPPAAPGPQAGPRMAAPSPPHRSAPTTPQPAAMAAISADLSARETALYLLTKTEGALARHTLLQVASLPDAMPADGAKSDQPPPRITLDIPLLTAQGNAAAQIRIEREQSGAREGADVRPVWRACFSIDVEPIGPVRAHVALHGERATVTLYAERDESAARLREGLPHLEAGLKDAALDPGEILCRSGAPAGPRHAAGLFVDQAS